VRDGPVTKIQNAGRNRALALQVSTPYADIVRWENGMWTKLPGTPDSGISLFTAAGADVWVAGAPRLLMRGLPDGGWEDRSAVLGTETVNGLFATGADDVYVTSSARVYRFDGSAFVAEVATPVSGRIFGSGPGDVWFVNDLQLLRRTDAGSWVDVPLPGGLGPLIGVSTGTAVFLHDMQGGYVYRRLP
jgi:hypothetical protein